MRKVLMVMLAIFMLVGCTDHKDGSLSIISEAKAKECALDDVKLNAEEVSNVKVEFKNYDDFQCYIIEFEHNEEYYSYKIDALTGKVFSSSTDISQGMKKAKQIALDDQGFHITDILFHEEKCILRDDNYYVVYCYHYEKDSKEYEEVYLYTINHDTFEIRDCKIENYCELHHITFDAIKDECIPSLLALECSENDLKQIALSQVPGASLNHITEWCKQEHNEHGALIYQGKISYQGNEYCFEIDGYSGGINNWECTHHVTGEIHNESHNSSHHEKEPH